MLRPRVIPILLLSNAGLYKTRQFKNPIYIGDPINTVRIFNEKECDEIVILDIEASLTGREPATEVIADIVSEGFMPIAYGGGIRTVDQVRAIFKRGVEKIVLNTVAAERPEMIRQIAAVAGSSSVVVSIDVKRRLFGRYEVFVRGGRESTGRDPVEFAQQAERLGAGEILLNSIDRDGTMEGYDLVLIQRVARAITIPLIVCGGAGSLEDFASAIRAGASGVSAGSMFVFQGKHRAVLISYPLPSQIEALPRSE
jgi:imidazole glycerol-phosphate synthase subunit HisF